MCEEDLWGEAPHHRFCTGPSPRHSLSDDDPGRVYCWPSDGGIWVAEKMHPVQMKALNLSRFGESFRADNATEEDVFCQQLKTTASQLTYFPNENSFLRYRLMSTELVDHKDEPYPPWNLAQLAKDSQARKAAGIRDLPPLELALSESGGIWALKPPSHENRRFWISHQRALTQVELCAVLEDAGAGFWPRRELCPLLSERLSIDSSQSREE